MIGLYDRIIQCQVKHYCCHLGFKTPLGLKVISYQRNWVNQQNTSIVDTLGLISCLNHWDSTYIIYRCSSPESGERDVDLPHDFLWCMYCISWYELFEVSHSSQAVFISYSGTPKKSLWTPNKNWIEGKRSDGFTKHFPQDLVQPLLCQHLATLGFEFPCFGLEIPNLWVQWIDFSQKFQKGSSMVSQKLLHL